MPERVPTAVRIAVYAVTIPADVDPVSMAPTLWRSPFFFTGPSDCGITADLSCHVLVMRWVCAAEWASCVCFFSLKSTLSTF